MNESKNSSDFGFLIFLLILSVFVLLVRAPDVFPPRFWAEDLFQFIHEYQISGLSSLFRPYAGYLHAVPRLSAAALSVLPIEWAAWWFTLVMFVVTLWVVSILIRVIGGCLSATVAALSVIIAPGWSEPIGSVTNLQWIMAPALLCVILRSGSFRKRESITFVLLSSLSGPFSVAFGPIVFASVLVNRLKKGQWNWEALTCGACAAIQVCVIIYSSTPTATEPPQILWLLWRLTELPFQLSLWPLGALLLLASTVWHGDDKWFRAAILIGVLSLTLIIAFKFNHQPSIFVSGTVAQRYWYVQSVLWLLIAASALRERSLLLKIVGAAGLIVMMWYLPFEPKSREWPWATEDWPAFTTRAREGEATFKYAPNWTFNLQLSH
ncbi:MULTISPECIES: hypothetical protein [unclassified Rhizobium]|uniref:hypothetical protein n=1 Tax=unclassified Rhizobium TaxID=2613769 RepID=UPI001ADBC952|nr:MULTISPECIES: hypothetical protein [unclassified Rhizobium]MBO9101731.1 hypothetical protein [Rhizobium sp. L58/93]QXZ87167.1 hypothetical protein J5287_21595 [Rhizobium sp. K1/93]QXZ92800.1 hypothetical protein J5280_19300 [Rhizobium sp. K15/93]QYA03981.1 hypothetical protein J5278_24795 [Rhizobium sp. B21/90]